jgi:hypothetical protein
MSGYRTNRWEENSLRKVISTSKSIAQSLSELGLKAAGGNYAQFNYYVQKYTISISHFTGKNWRTGLKIPREPVYKLSELLVENSRTSIVNLKRRLYQEKLKEPICEECGWAQVSVDGRVPVELDHINGNHFDNRLNNLRILCPNCHSLKVTHRGSNIRNRRRGGETGIHATLKTL